MESWIVPTIIAAVATATTGIASFSTQRRKASTEYVHSVEDRVGKLEALCTQLRADLDECERRSERLERRLARREVGEDDS